MAKADGVSIAQLAIFLVLIQFSTYCLWRHGKHGILGWLYVQIFCAVRIIGAAITIHDETTDSSSTASLILSSVGLSPLLLATAGVLHEARRARNPLRNKRLEWFMVIQYHLLVSAALVCVIIGVVYVQSNKNISTAKTVLEVGTALVILAWLLLIFWVGFSMRPSQKVVDEPSYPDGTKLLYAAVLALPCVGLRLIYAVTSLLLQVTSTPSAFTTSLAVRVCLAVVPEMLLTVILIVAGVATRNIKKTYRM